MKRNVLALFAAFMVGSIALAEDEPMPPITDVFEDGRARLDIGGIDEKAIRSIEKESQHAELEAIRIRNLAYLWFAKDSRDALRLRWWESESRKERLAILILFLALSDEPISIVPDFKSMAAKFGHERKQRIEEIEVVRKVSLADLRKVLKDWAAKNLENVTTSSQAAYLLEFYGKSSGADRSR